ncbi:hypothetical protein ACJW8B_16255 [Plesiomonas shigelloides]|uniref:phosphoribosyltransferase-like protein n=1 Tax=Plesiomonas shigelloides TaxID=703 RepID=UPI00387EEF2C
MIDNTESVIDNTEIQNIDEIIDEISAIISCYKYLPDDVEVNAHVNKWLLQFDSDDRRIVAKCTLNILSKVYLPESFYIEQVNYIVRNYVKKNIITNSSFLDLQAGSESQKEINKMILDETLRYHNVHIPINDFGKDKFFYFDDVVFSGGRIYQDMRYWIINIAPNGCELFIIVMVCHSYALYDLGRQINNFIRSSGKSIRFDIIVSSMIIENKVVNRNSSSVFWLDQASLAIPTYIRNPYNFTTEVPRTRSDIDYVSSAISGDKLFSLFDADRSRFERILLEKGFYIISQCTSPDDKMKPLGYKIFNGAGFGGTVFTYRNCPNNTPLVYWWGNPKAMSTSPLSKWYPLMQRKPNGTN